MSKRAAKRQNRDERGKRIERQWTLRSAVAFAVLFAIVIGCVFAMSGTHRHKGTYVDSMWYVEDGTMEVAAPALESGQQAYTAEDFASLSGDGAVTLPENIPSPEPTDVPTPEPTAQPTVEVTATPEPGLVTLKITAVGDCTLGGNKGKGERYFDKVVNYFGYDYFFAKVRDIFENDDLTIVNLEGPLTTYQKATPNLDFNFRGRPAYTQILSGSSVEICNLANNHSRDFGMTGLYDTANALDAAGIGASGYSVTYYTTVKGVRVASMGFTEWDYKAETLKNAVAKVRPNCDLLIVSCHWGEELRHQATRKQKLLGHAAIDGGADLVIGNHPHVYGGIEYYKGKYILYSLGNFCFGGNANPRDKRCLIFQQSFTFTPDGQVQDAGINIIPASVSGMSNINNFQPVVMEAEEGAKLLKNVAALSNLSMADTVWMPDNYMVQNGLMTMDTLPEDDMEVEPDDTAGAETGDEDYDEDALLGMMGGEN